MKQFLTGIGAKHSLRLALIPALGCVLVAVLFWPKPNSAASQEALALNATSESSASPAKEAAEYTWPSADIEEIVAFNLFSPLDAPGSQIPEDQSSLNPSEAESLKQAVVENATNQTAWGKLQAIISDERGAAAIFDSCVIHVGDQLPGVGRVVAINPREIVFVANE